jgi:hypothetical protein
MMLSLACDHRTDGATGAQFLQIETIHRKPSYDACIITDSIQNQNPS